MYTFTYQLGSLVKNNFFPTSFVTVNNSDKLLCVYISFNLIEYTTAAHISMSFVLIKKNEGTDDMHCFFLSFSYSDLRK